ncbi:chemotaxis protein CheB [Novipirellula rosea]|uniref:chemotaxis protein CheB n=1 Tax=Novipirellula rosea TaxID=1031540 RepID=UPI003CD05EA8
MLQAMPDAPGVALVIIQHLAPDKPSLAPELLARYTKMEVRQVDDQPVVEPDHVYVIPPGKFLSIVSGKLQLTQMKGPRLPPVSVDFFFPSIGQGSASASRRRDPIRHW